MILMDTHIFIWFQLGSGQLNKAETKEIIEAQQSCQLALSAISIWELAMLEKRERVTFNKPLNLWLERALKGVKLIPIGAEIALESVNLPSCDHKDPADRFILATARALNYRLMTHDQKLIAYASQGYVSKV